MRGGVAGTRVPVETPDCFLFALDDLMRRTGQGAHISQSVLELDAAPDPRRLEEALVQLVKERPLLCAKLRRSWRTLLPFWTIADAGGRGVPLGLWREPEAGGRLPGTTEIADAWKFLESRLAVPITEEPIPFNARLDLIERGDGTVAMALTWSHLCIDGKGAEMLFREIARLYEGLPAPPEKRAVAKPQPRLSLWEKVVRTKGASQRFRDLSMRGIQSLSGPEARPGEGVFEMVTLPAEQARRVRERADGMTGPLFPLPYYLACALRAHARVARGRGSEPDAWVVSVPIQTRKRGARGPIFHNQMTILFFSALREHLGTLEHAAAALKEQFAEMTRQRLDTSFMTLLELMMRLPSRLFMRMVRWQFKGEITSFFHSHTGEFAPELASLGEARVLNGYHLPAVSTPPGTGVFFCEKNGQLNVTISRRRGVMSGEESRMMMGQLMEDLLGEKAS